MYFNYEIGEPEMYYSVECTKQILEDFEKELKK